MMTLVFFNAWGILVKGGAMMWPILLLSIVAVTITIEKTIQLNAVLRSLPLLREGVMGALRANQLKEAVRLCEETPSLLGKVIKAGVLKFGAGRDTVKSEMEQAAVMLVHQLKQRLDILALITNVAPLLGLLGTVAGLCVVFHAVQMRSNALNPLSLGDMSSGIWQALLTTAAGLIVGIISLSVYSFCASRVNDVIMQIEQLILEITGTIERVAEIESDQ